jgi:hypothetical protein
MASETDPLARVIFVLTRDDIPIGPLLHAIERARLGLGEVPDNPHGALARELADRIRSLES